MCSTRAGGQWVRRARGSTQPSRRSAPCYVLCCRAARIRSLATSREAVGKLLVPATQHGAGCGVQVCEGVGSRMVEQHCGRRLRCSRISVGNVWWWGVAMGSAPERGDGGEGAVSLCNFLRLRRVFVLFYLTPRLTPRLAPLLPLALSTPCGGARCCASSPSGGGRCASPGVY